MVSNAPMKSISRIFAPTNNRRLNELIGFLLCVSALLLFLALASYLPLDPSFNTACRVARVLLLLVLPLGRADVCCSAALAATLYVSPVLSFPSGEVGAPARCAAGVSRCDRDTDWIAERAKCRMRNELDKRRASRP